MKVQWTHLALHVKSLQASVEFYERYTNLRVADRHSDASSTGMEVVWLSEGDKQVASASLWFCRKASPNPCRMRSRSCRLDRSAIWDLD